MSQQDPFQSQYFPRRQLSTERLYDRNFTLVMLVQASLVVANTLLVHYSRWIEFLGGDVREVGLIIGAGSILGVLTRPWIGQWINRLGAKNTWALGFVIFGIGAAANLLLNELTWSIYIVRSCLALGPAIAFTSSITYVTQTTPTSRRTEALGIIGAAGFLGMFVGPQIGDMLVGSAERSHDDFKLLFLLTTFAALIPFAMLSMLRQPDVPAEKTPVGLQAFLRLVKKYWPGSILLLNITFGATVTVPLVFIATYIDEKQLFMPWQKHIPWLSTVTVFFFFYAIWGMSVRITLRRLPERIGRRKVALMGLLILAVGLLCYGPVSSQNPLLIIIPALICGTGHALAYHPITALALERFPDQVRGTATALCLMMNDIGLICGAPLLGLIADNYGFDWLFRTLSLACFAVSGMYAVASIPVWRQQVISDS